MRKLLYLTLLLPALLLALPADDVVPLPNRDYYPTLIKEIQKAKKTLHIFMFSARYYRKYKDDPNSVLLNEIIKAKQRGVDVVVILDASSWNVSNTLKNKEFGDSLKSAGVKVYYDPIDITSHDKLIIIDGYITFVGSHNWSYFALARNNEASVMIKSKAVADYFEKHFQDVLRLSTTEVPKEILE